MSEEATPSGVLARIIDPETGEEATMSRRARKRRDRKKGGANHGKRPNT